MAEHEKKPLLLSSDSEEYGRKFDTFPRNDVQIQEAQGAQFDAAATPKRRYRIDNFLPCDPRRYMHRFLMLILMCLLSFGSYYCYDNPTALQTTIERVMNVNVFQYNLLYSLYSWPNVVLSLIGGVLIDRYLGIRWGTIVFSAFVCLGQLIFALGGLVDNFVVMLIGRFVFGIGGESLAVAQNNYAVLWFKGRELNMVFGLLLSISRVGSTVNQNINQKMYDSLSFVPNNNLPQRLGVVLLVGFLICIASLISAVVLGLFDYRAEKITKRKKGEGERISLKDIRDFPLSLWVIFIICVAYYVTVFPFIGLATPFLQDKYGVSGESANLINSLVYVLSAVVSPLCGIFIDRTGFNLVWLNTGIIATLGAHAAFAFLPANQFIPYIATIVMGIAYSILACALWPLVAYIVPEHQLGTAYGLMQSIQNLGLAIVGLFVGLIVDSRGYLMLETFFLAMLSLALIFGIILYILDVTTGGNKMNMSAWARSKLEKQRKEEEEAAAREVVPGKVSDLTNSEDRPTPLRPSSAFHLRNRLLSRMGTQIPDHLVAVNPLSTSMAHIGVLK